MNNEGATAGYIDKDGIKITPMILQKHLQLKKEILHQLL